MLALLLAALLAGSGIGSFMSRKVQGRLAVLAGALSAVAIMLILGVIPALFSALHHSQPSIQTRYGRLAPFFTGHPDGTDVARWFADRRAPLGRVGRAVDVGGERHSVGNR